MPIKKVRKRRKPNKGSIKKGEVRNPHGRPPVGKAIADLVRARLKEMPKGQKKTYGELLVDLWIMHAFQRAQEGNSQLTAYAWRMLAEYDSGRPAQRIEGAEGGPVQVEIIKRVLPCESR